MHWTIFCIGISALFVSAQLPHRVIPRSPKDTDYEYTSYDLELEDLSNTRRRVVRKINRENTRTTHRQLEFILTEPTTSQTINEERKLRYNEKVYLPEIRGIENSTSGPHQVLKNSISIRLMSAERTYQKDAWTRICQPLTGSAHPDGPLDYFDAVQAMRPPNFFPASDEGPAGVKFFGEKRFPANDQSISIAMQTFLRCLLSVISHVADDTKRRKVSRMFYTSMIGWLKDSLLIDMYALPDRPEKGIMTMEDTVEALVYMRNKHFVPNVAKDALRTYEFISVGVDDEQSAQEKQRGFQVTTAVMIAVVVAFLFVLVLLGACVAAALSSPVLQQINELPEDFLPLDYRQSQLMDRTGRRETLTRNSSPRLAVPAGYDQQVRKLSVLPDSEIGSKVRRTSIKAAQEQMNPLLASENCADDDSDDSTSLSSHSKDGSTG